MLNFPVLFCGFFLFAVLGQLNLLNRFTPTCSCINGERLSSITESVLDSFFGLDYILYLHNALCPLSEFSA